jgi:hypothetical protein
MRNIQIKVLRVIESMSELSIIAEMVDNDHNHLDVPRDSFTNSLTGIQILTYILKSISDGKNEN